MLKGKLDSKRFVPIVSDGGIGHPDIADGRIIPVLVIDCVNHPQLYDLILIHEHTPPGDVIIKWGRNLFHKKHAYLTLEFQQPVKNSITICFALSNQTILVDGIIRSRGVYLQPLQSGCKVSDGLQKPKILIEVPPSATFPSWDKLHRAALLKRYAGTGLSNAQLKELVEQRMQHSAELWMARRSKMQGEPQQEA
ncbi:MAG: hypothetical protein Q8O29_18510 [Polaromonas sp.]|uniref:hypothetical protein n=1 Tax=Polaromonas sp. TaxID=1869339 RepID=UPI0027336A7B|nr:hypothetical protein [Polaromonas sp.]MDP2820226.1 hypothetical protein [Polaromonas sp.]